MSTSRDLLVGLAGELVTGSVALMGPQTDPATGIYFKALPTSPDRAVALTIYSSVDQPKVALSTFRVQFWFRGKVNDSVDVDDLGDAAFTVLQGLEDRVYGSVHLVQCLRVSSVPLGVDVNKRAERSDNYQCDVDMPLTALRPW